MFRYLVQIVMTFVISWFTYLSFEKFLQEETTISLQYTEDEVQLPSVTVCVKWLTISNDTKVYFGRLGLPKSENWTFDDYMAKSRFAQNFFSEAYFVDQIDDKVVK